MEQNKKGGIPKGLRLKIFASVIFCLAGFAGGALAAAPDHIVINEIQTDSVAGAGGSEDDWVELYNPTASPVTLDGWSIQKTTGSFSSLVKKDLIGTIPAGGHFLIVRNNVATSQALKDAADILAGSTFSLADNNVVYLVSNNENMATSSDPDIIDFVGFGASTIFEGAGAAVNPAETKSIARAADGADSNDNSSDFFMQNIPTPENSALVLPPSENEVGGTVLLTIAKAALPEQNIGSTGADIVFSVNGAGSAVVYYGLDGNYGSTTAAASFLANVETTISLANLTCGTTYHYSLYAENTDGSDSDSTLDAAFTTDPCGINLDSLTMTKTSARANNNYTDGWEWTFNITVWDTNETSLKMKFNAWTGAGALDAANNMRFSVDGGATWSDITANGEYPAGGADISAIDNDAAKGRQVEIKVNMKVPSGTLAGTYNSNYGILTE